MVEYVVILSAITVALLTPGLGSVEDLEDAVQDKQRGYSYALSLSAIPETDDLTELADYYDSLGKYPELSAEIRSGDQAMKDFVESYTNIVGPLKDMSSPSAILDDAKECLKQVGQSTINLLRGAGFC